GRGDDAKAWCLQWLRFNDRRRRVQNRRRLVVNRCLAAKQGLTIVNLRRDRNGRLPIYGRDTRLRLEAKRSGALRFACPLIEEFLAVGFENVLLVHARGPTRLAGK